MPLVHRKSPQAFKTNVRNLMGEVGESPHVQSRKQALAIAYSVQRRAKKAGGGPVPVKTIPVRPSPPPGGSSPNPPRMVPENLEPGTRGWDIHWLPTPLGGSVAQKVPLSGGATSDAKTVRTNRWKEPPSTYASGKFPTMQLFGKPYVMPRTGINHAPLLKGGAYPGAKKVKATKYQPLQGGKLLPRSIGEGKVLYHAPYIDPEEFLRSLDINKSIRSVPVRRGEQSAQTGGMVHPASFWSRPSALAPSEPTLPEWAEEMDDIPTGPPTKAEMPRPIPPVTLPEPELNVEGGWQGHGGQMPGFGEAQRGGAVDEFVDKYGTKLLGPKLYGQAQKAAANYQPEKPTLLNAIPFGWAVHSMYHDQERGSPIREEIYNQLGRPDWGGPEEAAPYDAASSVMARQSPIEAALTIARQAGGALPLTGAPGSGAAGSMYAGPLHTKGAGRTDNINLAVESGSYVVPADVVSILGEGNTLNGQEVLKALLGGNFLTGGIKLPPGRSGKFGVPKLPGRPKAPDLAQAKWQGKKEKRAEGGRSGPVPIIAAGGEHIISPTDLETQFGSLDHAHDTLDNFVKLIRDQEIERLKTAPPPKK